MSKRPNRKNDAATDAAEPPRNAARPATPPPIDQRAAEPLDPAHAEAVDEGMAQVKQNRFASDESVEALFRGAGA